MVRQQGDAVGGFERCGEWVENRQFVLSPKLRRECDFQEGHRKQPEGADCEEHPDRIARFCAAMCVVTKFEGEPTAVFIVHEASDNPHSERAAIQEYFRKNGVACEEVDL